MEKYKYRFKTAKEFKVDFKKCYINGEITTEEYNKGWEFYFCLNPSVLEMQDSYIKIPCNKLDENGNISGIFFNDNFECWISPAMIEKEITTPSYKKRELVY